MRTITVKLYQFDELPTDKAKEKARDWYRKISESDTYAMDEIIESLKMLFKKSGIKLVDWSIGGYRPSSVTFDMGDAGALTGARAVAWLENNLFAGLRMTREQFKAKRKEYMGYGPDYRAGKIEPCPLTGTCYDEDLLDELQSNIQDGMTLNNSYAALADKAREMIEAEYEYQNEDEQVDESIRANEYEFTEDGKRAQYERIINR